MDKEVYEFLGQEESSCCLIWPDYSKKWIQKQLPGRQSWNFHYLSAVTGSWYQTAFTRKRKEITLIAPHCEMIPTKWVCQRIATASFLKMNPYVKEGYKFYSLEVEIFFQNDAIKDPQCFEENLIATKFCFAVHVVSIKSLVT